MMDDNISPLSTPKTYSCSNCYSKKDRKRIKDEFIFDIFRHDPPEYLKNKKKPEPPKDEEYLPRMDDILKSLKRGDQSKIALELKVSKATINNILTGHALATPFNIRVAKRLMYVVSGGDESKFSKLKKKYLKE